MVRINDLSEIPGKKGRLSLESDLPAFSMPAMSRVNFELPTWCDISSAEEEQGKLFVNALYQNLVSAIDKCKAEEILSRSHFKRIVSRYKVTDIRMSSHGLFIAGLVDGSRVIVCADGLIQQESRHRLSSCRLLLVYSEEITRYGKVITKFDFE